MRLVSALLAAAALASAAVPSARAQTVSTVPLLPVLDVRESAFVDDWQAFTRFKGELYFAADGGDGAGTELWRTDGTAAGTVRLTDLVAGSGHAYPQGMTVHGGHLYFTASADGGGGLFRTDGVNPPARFVPIGGVGAGVLRSTSIGLFGTMNTAATGTEPWFSDGNTFGMLADIGPTTQSGRPVANSGFFDFTDRNGTVFFAANDRTSQRPQLWKTLGTTGSTQRVIRLMESLGYADYCNIYLPVPEMFSYGGTLYFVSNVVLKGMALPNNPRNDCFDADYDVAHNQALWTSTGSPNDPNATRPLAATLGQRGNRVWIDHVSARWRATSATGPVGGVYLVQGRDEAVTNDIVHAGPPRLYAFDGSSLTPLFAGEPTTRWEDAFAKVGDVGGRRVFLRSRFNQAGSYFQDAMATDGTPAGTSVLATYPSHPGSPQAGDAYGGAAYFVAGANLAKQLYRTNGTGTPEVLTALPTGSSYLNMGAALPGGAVVYTDNGIGEGTVYFVGTPAVRVVRQPLAGTGASTATLSDGAGGTLGVTFDVQAITGSGAMRLQLLDHAADPLEGGAPTTGVLRRYVRIERPTSITSIETALTLSYTDDDLAEAGVADESALVVWKYSEGVWTRLVPSDRDLVANTITLSGITSFSDFAIADGASSLPVELAAFTAVADGSTARLAWATASETNNAGFAVEHRQGTAWVERGFVNGHGTTTERHDYAFDVANLTAGTHTFRLRQTDTDGTLHYSANIAVEIRVGTGTDEAGHAGMRLTVLGGRAVRVETNDPADVSAYDVLGRRVMTQTVASGTTVVPFDGLSAGVYLVRVEHNGTATTTRIVVR